MWGEQGEEKHEWGVVVSRSRNLSFTSLDFNGLYDLRFSQAECFSFERAGIRKAL